MQFLIVAVLLIEFTLGAKYSPSECPDGSQVDGNIGYDQYTHCFTPCKPGYREILKVCYETCKPGFADWGFTCKQKGPTYIPRFSDCKSGLSKAGFKGKHCGCYKGGERILFLCVPYEMYAKHSYEKIRSDDRVCKKGDVTLPDGQCTDCKDDECTSMNITTSIPSLSSIVVSHNSTLPIFSSSISSVSVTPPAASITTTVIPSSEAQSLSSEYVVVTTSTGNDEPSLSVSTGPTILPVFIPSPSEVVPSPSDVPPSPSDVPPSPSDVPPSPSDVPPSDPQSPSDVPPAYVTPGDATDGQQYIYAQESQATTATSSSSSTFGATSTTTSSNTSSQSPSASSQSSSSPTPSNTNGSPHTTFMDSKLLLSTFLLYLMVL